MQIPLTCIVCDAVISRGLASWHYRCEACKYEGASLQPSINEASLHEALDEGNREIALRELRKASFKIIVAHATQHVSNGSLLDVGSAHGWFLEEAAEHYEVLGLEPDQVVFQKTVMNGKKVRNGFFPDALESDELFNVIVFNDVIEHIPSIDDALKAANRFLAKDGILILNLPNSAGLFYGISKLMTRIGLSGPFDRMWQKGLPSPHVHYFNSHNLGRLALNHGFVCIEEFELPSVSSDGLLERIRFVGGQSAIKSYIQYGIVRAMIPFVKLFQSDIVVKIFKKA